MLGLFLAAAFGAVLTLAIVYALGKRHQRHTGRSTGPNSRVPVSETAIHIVKKG